MTRADLRTTELWAGDARVSAADLIARAEGDDEMRRRLAAVAVAVARVHDLAGERLSDMTGWRPTGLPAPRREGAAMGDRDITSVIGDVLGCVPADRAGLAMRLDHLRTSCLYTSPEQVRERWVELEQILVEELGTPAEQWHRDISRIVRGSRHG